jgi:hypothetical protein
MMGQPIKCFGSAQIVVRFGMANTLVTQLELAIEIYMPSNHALQRTRRERRGCSRCVPCAGSLSLGR